MERTQKQTEITAIRDRFMRMASAVVTDFRGIDVEKINVLRSAFRKAQVEYKVVKNTLVHIATKEQGYGDDLNKYLEGPTAIAWSYEDPTTPARIAFDFAKDNDKLKIKCGVVDGKVLDPKGVEMLSKMPGKKDLQGSLLATFMAPATDMVRLLAAGPTNFLYLLNARKTKLEEL